MEFPINPLLSAVLGRVDNVQQEEIMRSITDQAIANPWWRQRFEATFGVNTSFFAEYKHWKNLYYFYRDNGPANVIRNITEDEADHLPVLKGVGLMMSRDGVPYEAGIANAYVRHCKLGNTAIVEFLLRERFVIIADTILRGLSVAAASGKLAVVKAHFAARPDIEQAYDEHDALIEAIRAGKDRIVAYLLEQRVGNLWLALKVAVESDNGDAVGSILEKRVGAIDVNADDGYLLYAAVKGHHTDVVNILLTYGADPNMRGGQALYIAATEEYNDITDILVNKHNANLDLPLAARGIYRSLVGGKEETKELTTKFFAENGNQRTPSPVEED